MPAAAPTAGAAAPPAGAAPIDAGGGGALGVGLAVQAAVRNSVILIIVLGFVITWFFYFLA